MKSPRIFCIVNEEKQSVVNFLKGIGVLSVDAENADILLTDDIDCIDKNMFCVIISPIPVANHITVSPEASPQQIYGTIINIISKTSGFLKEASLQNKSGPIEDETKIVSGFTKHFSHNALNALLSAVGFLRQIKVQTPATEHVELLWKIAEEKLLFIEELVNGYNDYNYALSLRMTENIDVSGFFNDLILAVASKNFDKSFSAYLGYQTDNYNMKYEYRDIGSRVISINPLFLKLAFCYILKDTIRYLIDDDFEIKFNVTRRLEEGRLLVDIYVADINLPEELIKTMFRPWDHQMFVQSFDYWGIMIASTILEKHGGRLSVQNRGLDLLYSIEL